ncbi:hypothetical protein BKA67DRAFT_583811 [Truncatella angustata]|uniref:Zn(2)-C6 fungal-type domain-containing protein n=1 Tax=Truncatella angustata TaxID=152316 RepID=A0A9P8RNA7_9PEZI|nr:uncharacterized protein BKA67DRAFT_583811 [Truncatella angustata]KAH6646301.1 hypothetical protein BKA67DRAFT_583811 [Truncatella angustata]KAH8201129.1 hypothetical protein TruAng_004679 [Truncatella angustata]
MSSSSSNAVSARRRVCTSCQATKRRCDQRLPRCSRCTQRNQDCVYPSLANRPRDSSAPPMPSPDRAPAATTTVELHVPLSHFSSVLPGSPPTIEPVPVITGAAELWPLFFNASGPAKTAISRAAMEWNIYRTTSLPLQWVSQGHCPFINLSLYDSSGSSPSADSPLPTLRDAFAVCAAYAMKNDLNAPLVLGIVESKARGLVYDPLQPSWTPLQQLAALQALAMYQLIRWFDGDIRQRALADEDEAVLDSWTEALQARVGQRLFERGQEGSLLVVPPPQELGGAGSGGVMMGQPQSNINGPALDDEYGMAGGVYASSETVAEWRQFLFAESCRRTVVFIYTLRSMYAMASKGYCHIGHHIVQMSYMAGSAIWNANTAGRWNNARASRSNIWVERMDFAPMLTSASPDEVDSLSLLLAVSYKGTDVIEDWMSRRGNPQPAMDMGFGVTMA